MDYIDLKRPKSTACLPSESSLLFSITQPSYKGISQLLINGAAKPPGGRSSLMRRASIQESIFTSEDENQLVKKLKKSAKNKEDAAFIYSYIQKFPFFHRFVSSHLSNATEDSMQSICKFASYEFFSADSVIFNHGDLSNGKFYIILSGKVAIYLEKQNVFLKENKEEMNLKLNSLVSIAFIATQAKKGPQLQKKTSFEEENQKLLMEPKSKFERSQQISNILHSPRSPNSPGNSRKTILKIDANKFLKNPYANMDKANELGTGEAFGEKALLMSEDHAKRTATVVAVTNCEFMVVRKLEFDLIVQKFSKQNEKKMQFFMKLLPFLSSINSINTLENLIYSFKEIAFSNGSMVVEQGKIDSEERIFFLSEGKCLIEQEREYLENTKRKKTKCEISQLAEYSVIGEEILFMDKPRYLYSAKVISETAEFYYISKGSFNLKFPKEIKKFLQERFVSKWKGRKEIYSKIMTKKKEFLKEQTMETLVEANYLKNEALIKNMGNNMKNKYNSKVNSYAEMLDVQLKSMVIEKPELLDGVIEKIKFNFITKMQGRHYKNLDILAPEEMKEIVDEFERKHIIRKNKSPSNKGADVYSNSEPFDVIKENNTLNPEKNKLDFGRANEDYKRFLFQKIRMGIIIPPLPVYSFGQPLHKLEKKIERNRNVSILKNYNSLTLSGSRLLTHEFKDESSYMARTTDFKQKKIIFFIKNETHQKKLEKKSQPLNVGSSFESKTERSFEFKKHLIKLKNKRAQLKSRAEVGSCTSRYKEGLEDRFLFTPNSIC